MIPTQWMRPRNSPPNSPSHAVVVPMGPADSCSRNNMRPGRRSWTGANSVAKCRRAAGSSGNAPAAASILAQASSSPGAERPHVKTVRAREGWNAVRRSGAREASSTGCPACGRSSSAVGLTSLPSCLTDSTAARSDGLPAGKSRHDRREPGRVSVADLQIRHPELSRAGRGGIPQSHPRCRSGNLARRAPDPG